MRKAGKKDLYSLCSPTKENLNLLSPEMKGVYEKLKVAFQNCKIKIDRALTDEEELPFCGGIIVIHCMVNILAGKQNDNF